MAPRPPSRPENPPPGPEKRSRGRPPSIDTERLLEVAREVFLAKGIRATTAEVAEKAGVSEGAIFHRFKSKDEFFRAAMQLDSEEVPPRLTAMVLAIDGLELEEGLVQLARNMLELGRVALPLMMMSWSNPGACAGPSEKEKPAYRLFLEGLIRHFEKQVHAGKLRPMDAEVFARTFVGAIHHYCMTRILMGGSDHLILPEGMFVRGLVDLLLRGGAPEIAAPAAGPERRLPL